MEVKLLLFTLLCLALVHSNSSDIGTYNKPIVKFELPNCNSSSCLEKCNKFNATNTNFIRQNETGAKCKGNFCECQFDSILNQPDSVPPDQCPRIRCRSANVCNIQNGKICSCYPGDYCFKSGPDLGESNPETITNPVFIFRSRNEDCSKNCLSLASINTNIDGSNTVAKIRCGLKCECTFRSIRVNDYRYCEAACPPLTTTPCSLLRSTPILPNGNETECSCPEKDCNC